MARRRHRRLRPLVQVRAAVARRRHPPVADAKYDGSYRITANFLDWVVRQHDEKLVVDLNAAMRQGKYSADLWKQHTGKTVEQLGAEWKQSLAGETHDNSAK